MNILVANWKMAPDTSLQALSLAKATAKIAKTYKKNLHMVACVPSVYLGTLQKSVKSLALGAQTVAHTLGGAETGLVSAAMLKSLGATYSIVGHSESRARGDTDALVAQQLARLVEKKITPILCVGEKARDAQGWYLSAIKEQLETALAAVPQAALKRMIIAYEPVWAIGKDAVRGATPEECRTMVIFIRKIVADLSNEKTAAQIPVLYGGSVDETNAHSFITEGEANGLLVGRVSLEPKRFVKLAQSIR